MNEVQSVDFDDSIDLSSLTMVFITRNRQELVLKNSKIYQLFGAAIVILDGSDSPMAEVELMTFTPQIKYIHSTASLEQRLKLASEVSHTPFTIISTDDDLMVPSALQKSLIFLQDHPGILSCSGRTVGFRRTSSELNLVDCYPEHDDPKNWLMPRSVYLRYIKYIRAYSTRYFYSVYRTADWIPIYTRFVGEKPLPRNYLELIIEFRACLKGSHHTLPDLFWLRNFTNAPIRTGEKYRNLAKPSDYLAVMREVFSKSKSGPTVAMRGEVLKSIVICLTILALDLRNLFRAVRNKLCTVINFRRNESKKKEEIFELNVLLAKKNASCNQIEINALLLLV